jgi:hypothetical protein
MAKKRKKKNATAGFAATILPYIIASIVVILLSGLAGGLVGFYVGVCPGVAAGGGATLLCGLLWLAGITYAEWPDDLPRGFLARIVTQLAMIFVNGFVNFEQCIPQMTTMAIGFIVIIAGLGGWIVIAQVNPELNRSINPSLEMKKKDQAPPRPR